MEGDKNLLAPLVEIGHGGQQRADHELRAVIGHRVEFVAAGLDAVEHALDDLADAGFEPVHAARREGWQQQAANPGVALAVHLGDELHAHELVELLEAGTARHFRGETRGVGEDFLHVGIAAADDLGRPVCKYVERRAPCPFGQDGARVLFERAAAEVDVDHIRGVQFGDRRHHRSRSRQQGAQATGGSPIYRQMKNAILIRHDPPARLRRPDTFSPGGQCLSKSSA